MKKLITSLFVIIGVTITLAAPVAMVSSVSAESPQELSCGGAGGKWEKRQGDDAPKCYNNDNNSPSVQATIKNVVDLLLWLTGIIAVIVIVIAGFRFVTSNGDPQQVSKARNTIIYAVVGIVVAVMAYAIVNFVLDNV